MITASAKKRENIAEYLLYMWQIEDIIRACGLDIDKIESAIISRYSGVSEQQLKDTREWYESLIDMMRCEGKEKEAPATQCQYTQRYRAAAPPSAPRPEVCRLRRGVLQHSSSDSRTASQIGRQAEGGDRDLLRSNVWLADASSSAQGCERRHPQSHSADIPIPEPSGRVLQTGL